MWQVALLVLVCVLYVYVIERRARHFVQNQNMNPFDEKLLSKLVFVANFFKHKAIWSNIILVLGSVVSLMLFLLGIYLNEDGTLLVAFSLWSSFATISISASFEGTTWVKKVNVWVNSLSHSLAMRIIKTLTFELLSIIYLVLPFLFFTFMILFWYANGSDSEIRFRLIFYFLPIFLVLWVYQIGDHDEFQMKIRRFTVYIFVAVAYLANKDPLTQFSATQTICVC